MQTSQSRNVRLLVLSNGHGEDEVAVRILQTLIQVRPNLHVVVLPIVGTGLA